MAAYFPLLEPLLVGLKNYLVQYLPSKLLSISAEMADSIPLDPPPQGYIFTYNHGPVIDQFPCIEMVTDRGSFDNRISAQIVADVDHQVSFITTSVGGDQLILSTQMNRYMRALVELLVDLGDNEALRHSVISPKCFDVNVNAYQFFAGGAGPSYIRAVVVNSTIRTREGF